MHLIDVSIAGCCGALKSVLLVILFPITCPLGYCFRRSPPPKKPREEVVWLPPPPAKVIYEDRPPTKYVYEDVPAPPLPQTGLCPVYIPDSYHSLPNEGILQVDILQGPDVPIGFQDVRSIDSVQKSNGNINFTGTANQIYMPYSATALNGQQNVISDVAVGGWMPVGASR